MMNTNILFPQRTKRIFLEIRVVAYLRILFISLLSMNLRTILEHILPLLFSFPVILCQADYNLKGFTYPQVNHLKFRLGYPVDVLSFKLRHGQHEQTIPLFFFFFYCPRNKTKNNSCLAQLLLSQHQGVYTIGSSTQK